MKGSKGVYIPRGGDNPSPMRRKMYAAENPSSKGAAVRGSTSQPVNNPCKPKKGKY